MKARDIILIPSVSLCLAACASEAATTTDETMVEAVAEASVIDLTVEQLIALQQEQDVRLIDVRTAEEVAEGAIPGSEHIALDDFDPAALDLSDGREVVLYCRSGRRSGIAGEKLAEFTDEPAKHLGGGIIAWRESAHPVEMP
ncbi:MAG: rhodanese-like domain-containing protein [Pseudomonadota bacterium]